MASLTECLGQAGKLIADDVRASIHKAAGEYRQHGLAPNEAARKAIQDHLMETQAGLKEVEPALQSGATLYEAEKPATDGAKAEQEAAGARIDQVLREYPDLMVKAEDTGESMSAADFMAQAKAEADEIAADAPLMQIAAECAILNGL